MKEIDSYVVIIWNYEAVVLLKNEAVPNNIR